MIAWHPLGIFLERKNKMATQQSLNWVLGLETLFGIYSYVSRVKESNNNKIKVLCVTRFQDGHHINTKSITPCIFEIRLTPP